MTGPGKNYRDIDDPANFICTIPSHQDDYDNLGACLICRVPTINGLHPTARARLLAKRPDLAHAADPHPGGSDANDPEPAAPSPNPQMAAGSGSPNHPVLHWLNPLKQIVGHPGEIT